MPGFSFTTDFGFETDAEPGEAPEPGQPAILMETSGYILMEDGSAHILME